MPPLPPASKVLRVALSGSIATSDIWLSRFFIQFTGTNPATSDLATFVSAVATAYSTDLKALATSDRILTEVEATDLTSASGATSLLTTSVVGTASGATLPAQICTVISYRIARRYRGGHPRGYWPFGAQTGLVDAGHWTSGYASAVDTQIAAFFTAVQAAGWAGAGTLSHVSLSYFSGFTVITSPTTGRARNVPTVRSSPLIDPVVTLKTQTSIGTQRRREAFVD